MTEKQRTAVERLEGNLAIHAGAGSGKTTVLAHRYAEAVREHITAGASAIDRILVITFTNKAAAEIAERVRRVVGAEISRAATLSMQGAWVSTIHSFCSRLLRRHVLEAGLDPSFTLLDEVGTRMLQGEAYEVAAQELYGTDTAVRAVLEVFNPDTLRARTIACVSKVRALGLTAQDLKVDADPSALEAHRREVIAAAGALDEAFEQAATSPSAKQKLADMREWSARWQSCDLSTPAQCAAAAQLAAEYGVKNVRDPLVKELNDDVRDLLKGFQRAACALSRPDLLVGVATLAKAFDARYRALKRERGLLDFDDLQEEAVRLLESGDIAKRYRDTFRQIMVDEFQDTNDLQVRVLSPLRADNLCVVGDERQSIYGFRYADIDVFRSVSAELGTPLQLDDNFRSHPEVMAFINELFSQTHLFGPSFMRLDALREGPWNPAAGPNERVECVLFDAESVKSGIQREAEYVATRVREFIASGFEPAEIAILLRTATHVDAFASALDDAGVPTVVNAGAGLFSAREVHEVLQLLRCIAVPHDDGALVSVLAGRMVGASDDALLAIRLAAGRDSMWSGLLRLVSDPESNPWIDSNDLEALTRSAAILGELAERQSAIHLGDLVITACEAFDYDLTLHSAGARGAREWANVMKVVRYAESFERVERNDAAAFVEYLGHRSEAGADKPAPDSGSNAVRVMTVHAAKGLEFPVVFVADLASRQKHDPSDILVAAAEHEGRRVPLVGIRLPADAIGEAATPAWQRLARDATRREVEEEKRCLYVACTRAEEALVLTGCCDLSKPPGEGKGLIDWVRQGLQDAPGGSVALGTARVRVSHIRVEADAVAAEDCADTTGGADMRRAPCSEPYAVCGGLSPAAQGACDRPQTVSYSALHTHERCSLSYHARYRLGLKSFRTGAGSESLDYGSAFHAVMQAGGPSDRGRIQAVAALYGLSPERTAQLQDAVRRFAETATAREIEKSDRVQREVPFSVRIGETRLRGAIDLVAWRAQEALIVDYKTGKAPDKESGDLSGYQLQAECYAYTALVAGAAAVVVRFEFVEHTNERLEFRFDASAREALHEALDDRIRAIVEIEPAPSAEPIADCDGCPAAGALCDMVPRRG